MTGTSTPPLGAPTTSLDPETLCRQALPLVDYEVASVLQRLPRHVCRDDLVSAGMAALAAAARSFDPSFGVPFPRFAVRRIRGAILDELRAADWASRSVRTKARQRDLAHDVLCTRLGRTPTAAELAAEMGVAVAELDAMDGDVHRAVVLSVDALQDEGVAEAVLPRTSATPEAVLLDRERVAYLHAAIDALPERLRAVVTGYFLEDRPMKEMAEEFGVTESRISQLRAEAMTLLRSGLIIHLDPEQAAAEPQPDGIVARRRAAYHAAIAERSDFRSRVSVPAPRRPADALQARTA